MKIFHTFLLFIFYIPLLSTACTAEKADAERLSKRGDAVEHEFTLRSAVVDGGMAFVGVGGAIDGLVNPELTVTAGETVRIVLENGDGMMHDLAIPDLNVQTATITSKGSAVEAVFTPAVAGDYAYFCTISGHRQAGMEGTFVVTESSS